MIVAINFWARCDKCVTSSVFWKWLLPGSGVMAVSVVLRTDYSAEELRRLAKSAKTGSQGRRLLSLAAVLELVQHRFCKFPAGWFCAATRPRRTLPAGDFFGVFFSTSTKESTTWHNA